MIFYTPFIGSSLYPIILFKCEHIALVFSVALIIIFYILTTKLNWLAAYLYSWDAIHGQNLSPCPRGWVVDTLISLINDQCAASHLKTVHIQWYIFTK